MRRTVAGLVAMMLLAGGCSKAPEGGRVPDVAEAPTAAAGAEGDAPIAVSVPQIAYTYSYAFAVPVDGVALLQDRHIALCDRMGPSACRVLRMERVASDDQDGVGTLKLMVRAGSARAFGRAVAAAAAGAGGRDAGSGIAAEDLSKQIVDTEARLRARQLLADRLTELLRTRSGPVADLVAAERAVAGVQEEIDAARSWLAEARGRVAMSTVDISYEARGFGGIVSPLRGSLADVSRLFAQSLAVLIWLVAVLLPWALLVAAIVAAVRWRRRRAEAMCPADGDGAAMPRRGRAWRFAPAAWWNGERAD